MIIRTSQDLNKAKKSAQISSQVLKEVFLLVEPGITTLKIDEFIKNRILELDATPAFLNYDTGEGIYKFSSCISLNHQLVHTLPSIDSYIQKGDIITVDLGSIYKGIYSDISYTWEVKTNKQSNFLQAGKKAVLKAISKALPGNRVGDISFVMEKTITRYGYNVSVDLVGHGIGKKLHESPQIPCFGKKGKGPVLKENQLVAIEVMYMQGSPELVIGKDNFSLDTKDNKLSAQFEHTVLISNRGPVILTYWPE